MKYLSRFIVIFIFFMNTIASADLDDPEQLDNEQKQQEQPQFQPPEKKTDQPKVPVKPVKPSQPILDLNPPPKVETDQIQDTKQQNTINENKTENQQDTDTLLNENEEFFSEPVAKPQQIRPVKKPNKKPGTDDSKQPVTFTSKGLVATRERGIVELENDVKVQQGDLKLTADKAKIFFLEETKDVDKVFCKGNVRVTKQSEDPTERIKAMGNEAMFFNKQRKVVLQGDATLWRAGDVVKGKQITYELETGWITVDRVEGVMQPQENKKPQKKESNEKMKNNSNGGDN